MGHIPQRGKGHLREPGPQPSKEEKGESVGEGEAGEGLGDGTLGPRAARGDRSGGQFLRASRDGIA
eukprot:5864311-Pyramimonas_sp.AAC.1